MKRNNQTPSHGAGHAGSIFFTKTSKDMNHVNLIGKLTSSPRYYELPTGRKVAQFAMATNETYLDDEGKTKNKSHWHRMSAWGRWVKVLEELSSEGMEIAVEGKLTSRFFQKGDSKHFISEVEVNDLIIL